MKPRNSIPLFQMKRLGFHIALSSPQVISSFMNFHSALNVSFMGFTTVVINNVCLAAWAANVLRTRIFVPLGYH